MLHRVQSRRLALLVALLVIPTSLFAAERRSRRAGEFNPDHDSVGLFAGMESGKLEVKFIAKSDKEANILIKNNTDQPLNVEMPVAWVGVPADVPILAQIGGLGGGGGIGGGGGSQGVGGGGGGLGGGLGGGGAGGGGFFNVAPEKVGKLEVNTVCLDHGKSDPRSQLEYEIRPVDTYAQEPGVAELLGEFGQGRLNQRSVQAAIWHLRGVSWQEMAAKQIRRANGARYPYFSRQELTLAVRYAHEAQQLAKDRPSQAKSLASPGEAANGKAQD